MHFRLFSCEVFCIIKHVVLRTDLNYFLQQTLDNGLIQEIGLFQRLRIVSSDWFWWESGAQFKRLSGRGLSAKRFQIGQRVTLVELLNSLLPIGQSKSQFCLWL